jgi:hypothetical protein
VCFTKMVNMGRGHQESNPRPWLCARVRKPLSYTVTGITACFTKMVKMGRGRQESSPRPGFRVILRKPLSHTTAIAVVGLAETCPRSKK